MPGLTSHRDSSASVSATPSSVQRVGSDAQLQSTTKGVIEREIKDATFYVDLNTQDGILYADPQTVNTVCNDLRDTFRALTSGGDSSASYPRFPTTEDPPESTSYEPLVHLLNQVIDTASPHIPPSQLSGLRFHCFSGKMKDIYGSHKGLKPDIVGIIGEPPIGMKNSAEKSSAKKAELCWERVEVTVESKATVRDMVRQSGTYARCCLLSDPRRFFSLGIGFQYKNLEAYFFVYHRSGLSSSLALDLKTAEGFRGLVGHIIGILSIKGEADYGLDITRTQTTFCINNRYYVVGRVIFARGSLRGRCTTVYNLRGTYTLVS